MKYFIAFVPALILAGCLMEPERKPDRVITVDCRRSFDEYDSTGAAHFSCPVIDTARGVR